MRQFCQQKKVCELSFTLIYKTFFLGKIYRMTPNDHEQAAAKLLFADAQAHARTIAPRDIEAQTIAIILAAFDLATQSMSVKNKHALLKGETE